MQALLFLLVTQLVFGAVVLNASPNSHQATQIRHVVRQVLGSSVIADDTSVTDTGSDTPTPDQSSNPSDTSAPQPTVDETSSIPDNPASDQLSPTPQDTPADQQMSDSEITPSPTPSAIDEMDTTPTPTDTSSQDQITPIVTPDQNAIPSSSLTEIPTGEVTPEDTNLSPQPTLSEDNGQQTSTVTPNTDNANMLDTSSSVAVTNQDSLIANPQEISDSATQTAKQEDLTLTPSQAPQQKENNLITFAGNNIASLDNSLRQNDFSTSSFLTQRLSDQIDQTQQVLHTVSQADYTADKEKLAAFCKQADLTLKTQQLVVPEDMEQDIVIARAKCLATQ